MMIIVIILCCLLIQLLVLFEENLEKGGDSAGEQKESKHKKTISAKDLAELNGEISEDPVNEETVMEQIGATVSYLA